MGESKLQSYLTKNNAALAPKGAGSKGSVLTCEPGFLSRPDLTLCNLYADWRLRYSTQEYRLGP